MKSGHLKARKFPYICYCLRQLSRLDRQQACPMQNPLLPCNNEKASFSSSALSPSSLHKQPLSAAWLGQLVISAGSPQGLHLPLKVPFSGEQRAVAAVEIKHQPAIPSQLQCHSFKQLIYLLTNRNGQICTLCKERILLSQDTDRKS